jgi:uncharacterized protein with FMN-binding domain
MKTRWKVLIVLASLSVILVIAGSLTIRSIERNLASLTTVEIPEISLKEVPDGSYRGTYGALPVKVTVDVMVKAHRIEQVLIVEHINGQGKAAEALTDLVVARQLIALDAIAGATYSSKVLLLAIHDALSHTASGR